MRVVVAQLVLLLIAGEAAFGQLQYRPNREFRSLNTESYEIAVQKNGELSIALNTGEPVFVNVFPMMWIEGERAPEPMTTSGSWSGRFPVRDALGNGNGMTLRKEECTWTLRTYPTKPFLAVQVAFENTRKKPVTIRALFPWCVGEPEKGEVNLGIGTRKSIRRDQSIALAQTDAHGAYLGSRNIALYNPATGRSVVAGFLTDGTARAAFELDTVKPEKSEAFDRARFGGYFDPPVTVAPGGVVASDVLYLGIVEANPLTGLERYAHAVRAANQIPSQAGTQAHVWLKDGKPIDLLADALGQSYPQMVERPARPVDLFGTPAYETWAWSARNDSAPRIVAVSNAGPNAETRTISMSALGLGPSMYYHVYDVGHARYIGVVQGNVSIELKPGESRTLALTALDSVPQVVARAPNPFQSTDAQWDGARLTGRVTMAGKPERIVIVAPKSYAAGACDASTGTVSTTREGDATVLTMTSEAGREVEWSISFAKPPESR